MLIIAGDISKYASLSLVVLFCVYLPIVVYSATGNSTILNQNAAGSIIVRHIKSMSVQSLPCRVYGPIRSTHTASHGVVMTNLVGSFPYCLDCLLFNLTGLTVLTYEQTVCCMLVQHITALSVSSKCVLPGCCK